MSDRPKLVVVGLDSVPPAIAFDRGDLPTLRALAAGAYAGPLRSITPPITVPAWACMMTGRDPGELGIYGFRNRTAYAYDAWGIVTSASVAAPWAWEHLGRAGLTSIVVGVPPTYPPPPLRGWLTSCFLTPGPDRDYAYPAALRDELEERVGRYKVDVEQFRTDDKDRVLREVYEVTRSRFDTAQYLATTREWDFLMVMDIGPDRLHHALWRYWDPQHRKHVAGTGYAAGFDAYYRDLDRRIGEFLAALPARAAVLVVSDHGAKRMDGAVRVNEWLRREGYLALRAVPDPPRPLRPEDVDWPRSAAWGEGGYYSRLMLNVEGREPQGTVSPARYEAVRDELTARLEAMTGPDGVLLGTRVFKPEAIYRRVTNVAPDLVVVFGDLRWRSAATVGAHGIFADENDTGPDDANHDWDGIVIARGLEGALEAPLGSITDVCGLVLRHFGLSAPGG